MFYPFKRPKNKNGWQTFVYKSMLLNFFWWLPSPISTTLVRSSKQNLKKSVFSGHPTVHDYSGNSHHQLFESEARVALYSSGSPTSIEVPATEPDVYSRWIKVLWAYNLHVFRWWVIGCLDGRSGVSSFVQLNFFSKEEPNTNLCIKEFEH